MNNLYIIYGRYYDFRNDSITIGGVQTYIRNLTEIAVLHFKEVFILQMGESFATKRIAGVTIQQFNTTKQKQFEIDVYKWIGEDRCLHDSVVLFATDSIIFKNIKFKKSIAIQHGISWDIPKPDNKKGLVRVLLSKYISAYRTIKNLSRTDKVICVDFNFQNWFRSLTYTGSEKLTVIPNFTEIAPRFTKTQEPIKIIFARRLFSYRGTRVFSDAIIKVLSEYPEIEVTIAGEGPDEEWMREKLNEYKQITFIRYKSSESINIHSDKHIAVIPTVGSEGTSLSLLEAMSAQCAVICTDVGGMTNIVLDRYNGMMVKAGDAFELHNAITTLIKDKALREMVAENAYSTVYQSFSKKMWQEKWSDFFSSIQ